MKAKNNIFNLFNLICIIFVIVSSPVVSQLLSEEEMKAIRGQLEQDSLEESRIEESEPYIFDKNDLDRDRDLRRERDRLLIEEPTIDDEFKITRPTNFDEKPSTRDLSSDLKPFGYDLFSKATNTFAPASDIPIPADYVLGPGDNLKIYLFGNANKDYDLQISREGEIYFPEVGIISLAGLTFSEAKKAIVDRVNNQTIGLDVIVTLGKLRSITIFILGDAYQPGSYLISGLSTLSNALFVSGGVNTSGSLRNIQHKRNGKTVTNFDIYDLLLKGDTTNDSRLQSGDVILIPTITNRIAVTGEVQRPGLYELLENENIEALISYAGGLKPSANLGNAQIDTVSEFGLSLKKLDISKSSALSTVPKNGDVLHILPINNVYQDAILLSNYLRVPGFVPWTDNSRILDVIDPSIDLLNDTDRKYILVRSLDKKTGNYTFKQSNLEQALENTNSSDNIQLSKNDEIFFFKKIEINDDDEDFIQDLKSEERGIEIMDSIIPESKTDTDRARTADERLTGEIEIIEDIDGDSKEEDLDLYLSRAEISQKMTLILDNQSTPESPSKILNILGARYPGKYPLTEGMTVRDAIDAGGGLGENTFLGEAEYIEVGLSKNNEYLFTRRQLSLENSSDLDIEIKPGSTISFKSTPKLTKIVKLEGEVVFPGEYLISRGEKLSDLITRAGGLTQNAYPYGAYFTRDNLVEADKRRIDQAKRLLEQQLLYAQISSGDIGTKTADISPETLGLFTADTDEEFLGRLILDLDSILASAQGDIELEDGDLLRIPAVPNSVSVIGEVNAPATHVYSKGKSIGFYLSRSGEVNQFANENEIYIIAANGAIKTIENSGFFRGANNGLKPGDTIVVPLKVRTFSGVQAANEVTSIIYQLAVAAAAVGSF